MFVIRFLGGLRGMKFGVNVSEIFSKGFLVVVLVLYFYIGVKISESNVNLC